MSLEAEVSVIGCMLMDKTAASQAVDALTPEMFLNSETRRIFEAATDLYWEGSPIDVVTLKSRISTENKRLIEMAQGVPTIRHLAEYIRLVREDWQRWTIRRAAADLLEQVPSQSVEDSVESLRELVKEQELILRTQKDEGVSFTQAARQLLQWLQEKGNRGTIRTGFRWIDKATGGFLKKSVAVLCARSGQGKTDLAINMAVRMAKAGNRVQYFTMEMPAIQLMQRIASQVLRIDGARIRDKNLDETEMRSLEAVLMAFEQNNTMRFVEEPKISLQRLRHNIDLYRPDVIFIDHIGLMERPNVRDSYRALGLVSNELKQIALEKNIAVVELAQMNRQVEGRKDRTPTLSDIRESGDIEQDADYAFFIQPEDLTNRNLCGDTWADTRVYLLKNRHGRPGVFECHWQPQYHMFSEVEKRFG